MICTLDALPLDTFFINEKQKLHLVAFNVFLKKLRRRGAVFVGIIGTICDDFVGVALANATV